MRTRIMVAAVMLASLAGSTQANGGTGDDERRTVNFKATAGFYVDNDVPGPSGGDEYGAEGVLRQGGEKIGRFFSACTATSANAGECNVTLLVKGEGRIQLAGIVRNQNESNRLSIVGGTGGFSGAAGQARLSRLNDEGSAQRVELHIRH